MSKRIAEAFLFGNIIWSLFFGGDYRKVSLEVSFKKVFVIYLCFLVEFMHSSFAIIGRVIWEALNQGMCWLMVHFISISFWILACDFNVVILQRKYQDIWSLSMLKAQFLSENYFLLVLEAVYTIKSFPWNNFLVSGQ